MARLKKPKARVSKQVNQKYLGTEPIAKAGEVLNGATLVNHLSWYQAFADTGEAKKWFFEANPKIKSKMQSVPDFEFRTVGFIARLVSRGFKLGDLEAISYEKRIADILAKFPNVTVEKTERISVRDRLVAKATKAADALLTKVDGDWRDLENFDPAEWFNTNAISGAVAKEILAKFEPLANEQEPLINKIVEIAKSKIEVAQIEKKVRKARKPRAKSVDKILKTFKCKESDPALGIVSVKPETILGATEAWLYDTRKRLLYRVIAEKNSVLGVKGTTIFGHDATETQCKKVRKPDDVIKPLVGQGKRKFASTWNSIRAKAPAAKTRTNADMIILATFK